MSAMPQQRGCLFATISNPFYYQKITLYLFRLLSIQRSVLLARSIIRSLLILCAEAGPCVGAIDLLGRDIVHRDRDAQHAGERNEVSTHMAVNGHAMVGTPVCHNAVHIGERTLSVRRGQTT